MGETVFPLGRPDLMACEAGLTKRELFAAMAMQGIASSGSTVPDLVAESAVKFSDALIEELNKPAK